MTRSTSTMPAVDDSALPHLPSRRHTRHHRTRSDSEPSSNVSEEVRRQAENLLRGLHPDEVFSLLPKLDAEVRATASLLQSAIESSSAAFPEHDQILIDQDKGLPALARAFVTRAQTTVDLLAKLKAEVGATCSLLSSALDRSAAAFPEHDQIPIDQDKGLPALATAYVERAHSIINALLAKLEKELLLGQVDAIKRELKAAQDDAEYWKKQAEQKEQKISLIRGTVIKVKDKMDLTEAKNMTLEQLEAATRAARESAQRATRDTGEMMSVIADLVEDEEPRQIRGSIADLLEDEEPR